MLATTLRAAFPAKSPARYTLMNFYSAVADLTRTHWKTGAHPAPQSLAEDEEDEDWPAPQREELPSIEREIEEAEASSSTKPRPHRPFPRTPDQGPTPHEYVAHRSTMKKNFPEGWAPPRKLSREAMGALRQLHKIDPDKFTTPLLAEKFRISKEAVRRILKSKWEPTREQKVRMAEREKQARQSWKDEKRAKELEAFEKNTRARSRGGDRLELS